MNVEKLTPSLLDAHPKDHGFFGEPEAGFVKTGIITSTVVGEVEVEVAAAAEVAGAAAVFSKSGIITDEVGAAGVVAVVEEEEEEAASALAAFFLRRACANFGSP